ncbi:MAG: hypothetical protein A2252_01535 [Elusimicrobia bacterium RIFOXYA2_FULL_39_19]|nr:MAG: hypothetical protein A2252_01535 [Elusimicrobia bacterium RIFOXYA2_FULL_39_19]
MDLSSKRVGKEKKVRKSTLQDFKITEVGVNKSLNIEDLSNAITKLLIAYYVLENDRDKESQYLKSLTD